MLNSIGLSVGLVYEYLAFIFILCEKQFAVKEYFSRTEVIKK